MESIYRAAADVYCRITKFNEEMTNVESKIKYCEDKADHFDEESHNIQNVLDTLTAQTTNIRTAIDDMQKQAQHFDEESHNTINMLNDLNTQTLNVQTAINSIQTQAQNMQNIIDELTTHAQNYATLMASLNTRVDAMKIVKICIDDTNTDIFPKINPSNSATVPYEIQLKTATDLTGTDFTFGPNGLTKSKCETGTYVIVANMRFVIARYPLQNLFDLSGNPYTHSETSAFSTNQAIKLICAILKNKTTPISLQTLVLPTKPYITNDNPPLLKYNNVANAVALDMIANQTFSISLAGTITLAQNDVIGLYIYTPLSGRVLPYTSGELNTGMTILKV